MRKWESRNGKGKWKSGFLSSMDVKLNRRQVKITLSHVNPSNIVWPMAYSNMAMVSDGMAAFFWWGIKYLSGFGDDGYGDLFSLAKLISDSASPRLNKSLSGQRQIYR